MSQSEQKARAVGLGNELRGSLAICLSPEGFGRGRALPKSLPSVEKACTNGSPAKYRHDNKPKGNSNNDAVGRFNHVIQGHSVSFPVCLSRFTAAMRTGLALALAIERKSVVLKFEAMGLGDFALTLFNAWVEKFFYAPAVDADEMIVVTALVEFKDSLTCLKIGAAQNASLLKLCKYPIHGGQTHIKIFKKHLFIDVFRT
jgi:hypothetical protein